MRAVIQTMPGGPAAEMARRNFDAFMDTLNSQRGGQVQSTARPAMRFKRKKDFAGQFSYMMDHGRWPGPGDLRNSDYFL